MRIAIDARMIHHSAMHGIARYVYELLSCLREYEKDFDFLILVNAASPLMQEEWPTHMRLVKVKARWISFLEQWEIPYLLYKHKIDLFHAPSFVAPVLCPCKMVMTIHDLNHMVLSKYYTPIHQLYYRLCVKRCAHHSETILTVSKFSKSEITKNLGVTAQKIVVTHNGVSPSYHGVINQEQRQYVREIYELPEQYVFCLTNNKPHKNLDQLVRAYCLSELMVPLVLACPVNRSLIRLADSYGKKHALYFTRFIEDQHLAAVYSMASLFVYPSTYEGFGLPPLEAMACGTKTIVANSTSLPEVTGPHAWFVDPYDCDNMAETLKRALKSTPSSAATQAASLHARSFSWKKMTQKTYDIYQRCLLATRQEQDKPDWDSARGNQQQANQQTTTTPLAEDV